MDATGGMGVESKAGLTVEGWLAQSGARSSALDSYRAVFRRCEEIHGRPLEEASKRSLGALKDKLREMRTGPGYIRRLKAFYKAAGREDLASLCRLKQRTKRLTEADILTLPEVEAFIAHANSLRDRALFATLWGTGQRVGAICALRLGDVRTNGHGFALAFRQVKVEGEEHVGYFTDKDGAEYLRAWLAAYPFPKTAEAPLFPSYRGTQLTAEGALGLVKLTAKRANLGKRVYPHLFRHSRATHALVVLKLPVPMIKKLYGWSDRSTVFESTYLHLASGDAYKALIVAQGDAPEEEPVRSILNVPTEELRPVVPMVAPPGTPAADFRATFLEAMAKEFDARMTAEAIHAAHATGGTFEIKLALTLRPTPTP